MRVVKPAPIFRISDYNSTVASAAFSAALPTTLQDLPAESPLFEPKPVPRELSRTSRGTRPLCGRKRTSTPPAQSTSRAASGSTE